jgi:bifunctional non-homologous end joining protein LigD
MARPRALEPAPSLSLATPILCPQHAEERKAALKKLLRESHPGIAFNRHFDVEGSIVFHHACKLGCEGIVSKRLGSTYRGGRSADWIKIKNPAAPAVRRLEEEDWDR